MRIFLSILALAFAFTVQAREDLVEGGRSKNGLYEVRIVQDPDGNDLEYTYAIYDTRSGKRLAQLGDVGGCFKYEQAIHQSNALWNDSSSFVALADSDSRHTVQIYIFHVSDTSCDRLIVADFVQNSLGRVDATEIDLRCHSSPERWDGNQLHVILTFGVAHATRGRVCYNCEAVLKCAELDSIARLVSVSKPEDIEVE
ncbi:MAG: hypothetical protein B7Z37_22155 [Verrucomicrobia bacterium 12-59-8]|nr:MAG: hypothetical protein B7Z37_22155 [Verrucomicrobia bacterium 12-59-8]